MTADLDGVLAREGVRRGKTGAESSVNAASVSGINDLAEKSRPRRAFGDGLAVYSLEYPVADDVCLGARYANERNAALAVRC